MTKKTIPSEEVDLGQLFKIIGNGFRNFFNAIGNFIKTGFHYGILVLIFLKKNILYLGIASLIGGILGFILDLNKDTFYSSDMILKTNYGSAKSLYAQKSYIGNLVKNEDTIALAKYFDIKSNEASSLLGFEVEPFEKEKNILIDYDYYMTKRDTNFVKDFEFADYQKRISDADLRLQKVTFYATDGVILKKLSNGIKNGIANDYYQKIKERSIKKLSLKRKRLERDLFEIDSIRENHRKVSLIGVKTKNTTGGTNIDLSNKNTRTHKDIDLFEISKDILTQLENLKLDEDRSGEIVTVLSKFSRGGKYSSLKHKKWFRYSVFGFILMTLFILGKRFNNYLENYNE
jgi:hypothetical protein